MEECDCMCHKSKDILHFHFITCCVECSNCGKNIKIDYFDKHSEKCKSAKKN